MDTNQAIVLAIIISLLVMIFFINRNRKKINGSLDLQDLYNKHDIKEETAIKIDKKIKQNKDVIIKYETHMKINERGEDGVKINEENSSSITNDSNNKDLYKYSDKKIEIIDGIGPSYTRKLNENGVLTISDLIKVSKHDDGLKKLNEKTGIYTKLLEKWVIKADFLRIQGMRIEQVDKLIQIGIISTTILAKEQPEIIYQKLLLKYNNSDVPTINMIRRWIRISEQIKISDDSKT